jgi:WD40 repeat protein
VKRELERIEIPGEHEARERAWEIMRRAYTEREPTPSGTVSLSRIALAAAAAVLVAAAFTPPGRALLDSVRETIGVERAQPALFRLPTDGRLLARSPAGAWVTSPDGSKRFLGRWREASWSPHGLYVVAARENELAALEPDGDVRWKLARPDVRFPRWGGSRTDTRIAYLSGNRMHVVAGDGTGDASIDIAAPVAPAWKPETRVLAYATARGRVYLYDADREEVTWSSRPIDGVRALAWSDDGRVLAIVTQLGVLLREEGRVRTRLLRGGIAGAFQPNTHRLAVLRPHDVVILGGQRVFAGAGPFDSLAWSPNGRWLAIGWPAADQWVFLRVAGTRKLSAVSNIGRQFDGYARIGGWCCSSN